MPGEELKFVNIHELSSIYPNCFNSPPPEEIERIELKDKVKICNGEQRFWVELVEITPTLLRGKVLNHLLPNSLYNFGDTIPFLRENIYKVCFLKDIKVLVAMNFLKDVVNSEASDSQIREILNEINNLI